MPPHWPLGVMAVGLVAGAALVADEDIDDELELRVRARPKLPNSRSAAAPETSGRHAIADYRSLLVGCELNECMCGQTRR